MLEGFIAGKLANKMFEEDVFKIVKKHALGGALIMVLPLMGLDWLIKEPEKALENLNRGIK